MSINVERVREEIDAENKAMGDKLTEVAGRKDLTYDEKRDASLIALNVGIYNRLGDMIWLLLQKG